MSLETRWSEPALRSLAEVELRGYKVIPKIKIIFSIVDDVIYIEYIKNTWLSEETMLKRMGYCFDIVAQKIMRNIW